MRTSVWRGGPLERTAPSADSTPRSRKRATRTAPRLSCRPCPVSALARDLPNENLPLRRGFNDPGLAPPKRLHQIIRMHMR